MLIEVNNISKKYRAKPSASFCGGLFGVEEKYALKNVSFTADRGECIGIIGTNGSGKSTLLKILCGITAPTGGTFKAEGKISALLELGSSFNPEYNGISNIYLNGTVQGLTRKEIQTLIPQIKEFADIGDYIYKPVKYYSDGMFLRLAFACATALSPDILIIDEALSVGDFAFRRKCFEKIKSMPKNGACVILVSHDADLIRRFCTRVIWLDNGSVKKIGKTDEVTALYMQSVTGDADISAKAECKIGEYLNRFGSACGIIKNIFFENELETGKNHKINIELDIPEIIPLDGFAVSVSVKDGYGTDLTVITTNGIPFKKHGKTTVSIDFLCTLCRGRYSISVSAEDRNTNPIRYYDYIEEAKIFSVSDKAENFGLFTTTVTAAEIFNT